MILLIIPMLVRAVYGEVVFLRNKERDPVLHLFNVAPAVLGLFLAPYTKLAFVPVVMATIILIGVIL